MNDEDRYGVWETKQGKYLIFHYCDGYRHENDDCILEGTRMVVNNVTYEEALTWIRMIGTKDYLAVKKKRTPDDGGSEEH